MWWNCHDEYIYIDKENTTYRNATFSTNSLKSLSCRLHTMTQVFSEFWRLPGAPLVLEGLLDPIWMEFEGFMILAVRPFEIGAPGTPGVSHGTKIFGSKFFSYHPKRILFYVFYWLVRLKMPKNWIRYRQVNISV